MISWHSVLHLIPYILSFGISLGVGIFTWRRRNVKGGLPYAWVAISQASWTLGYIFELASPSIEGKIFWDDFQWLGVVGWLVGILAFAQQFLNIQLSRPKLTWGAVLLIPAVFLILLATNPLHGLVHNNETLVPGTPFSALEYDFTIPVFISAIYAYLMVFSTLVILIRKYYLAQPMFKAQIRIIVIGTTIPLIGTILTLLEIAPTFHRDLTPLTFAVSNLIVAYGLFRYHIFEIVPIAYRTIFRSMRSGFIILDNRGRLVDYNPPAGRLINRLSPKLIGESARNAFTDFPDLIELCESMVDVSTRLEIHTDQDLKYLDVSISPLSDQRGRTLGRMIIMRDVTEFRKIQTALRESEEEYRRLVEISPDWIWAIDPQGNHVFSNKAIKNILGYRPEEILGKSSFLLMHPDEQERVQRLIQDTIDRQLGWKDIVIRWIHKDGSIRYLESTAGPIRDAEGNITGYGGIDRDVTARMFAEEEIDRYAAQLEAAYKELDAFSYSVSHDLRAPLRAITGFSQTLIDEHLNDLNEDAQGLLRRVQESSLRMRELIDDLLRLSKVNLSEMTISSVDLSGLAEAVISELQAANPERKAKFTIEPGLRTEGDLRLLRVMMANLLGNAWKFTNKKKVAEITFGVEELNGQPCYYVRDNGVGFDMQYVDKIFDPFQRLHSSDDFEGTGIGLATVKRIVYRHEGQVWAEGEVDQGATIYFTL